MERLAKQQTCQLFIEQEIEKGLDEGKTTYAIGREVAALIDRYFQAKVNPHTIKIRAIRMKKKMGTNVPPEKPTTNESNALPHLKHWWRKARKSEQNEFKLWIGREDLSTEVAR